MICNSAPGRCLRTCDVAHQSGRACHRPHPAHSARSWRTQLVAEQKRAHYVSVSKALPTLLAPRARATLWRKRTTPTPSTDNCGSDDSRELRPQTRQGGVALRLESGVTHARSAFMAIVSAPTATLLSLLRVYPPVDSVGVTRAYFIGLRMRRELSLAPVTCALVYKASCAPKRRLARSGHTGSN